MSTENTINTETNADGYDPVKLEGGGDGIKAGGDC